MFQIKGFPAYGASVLDALTLLHLNKHDSVRSLDIVKLAFAIIFVLRMMSSHRFCARTFCYR